MKAFIEGLPHPLDGTDRTDSPYTITKITGLDDGVGTRREALDRPAAHGQFGMIGYLTGRPITIEGEIYTHSPEEQDHAILALTGLLAGGGHGRLTVESSGESTWMLVQRNGAPTITRDRWGLFATYTLLLWADDPRKYGEVEDFAAGEEATHRGNFPATPRLLIGAGSGGYTITGPAGRQVVVSTAPAGAHYIDFVNGGLFNSSDVRQLGAVTTYQPWTIPPGLPGVTASITGSRSLVQRVTKTNV